MTLFREEKHKFQLQDSQFSMEGAPIHSTGSDSSLQRFFISVEFPAVLMTELWSQQEGTHNANI